ncbi:MAG: hypothetical protein GY853_05685 [PVC group bacterium]|nr:hypothetical protein [PVC group bacterium]
MKLLEVINLFYKYAAGIYEGYRDKIEELSKKNPYPFREWFGKDGRAYIEFQPSVSGVDENVKKLLEEYGYTITDYNTGLASKDGRILRIGKILAKIRKEKIKELDLKNQLNEMENYDEALKEINRYMDRIEIEFQASKYRVSKGQEHLIVFSQDPHDVAKMSTERGWSSCMELEKGKCYEDVYCEVEGGGFVAYLITKQDRNIENPLARIHIKRFDNDKGVSIAVPDKSVYGNSLPGFYEAVEKWINQKQQRIEYGEYGREGGVHSDTLKKTHIIAPTNKEEIGKFIKTLYKIDPDWERLLKSPNLPKGLLGVLIPDLYRKKSTGHIDWDKIVRYKTLSEDFIKEFTDKLKWSNIEQYQKLSEGFIREFADKINWRLLPIKQNLSEDFIREFANKLNWEYISAYQKLSEGFLREFVNRIDWNEFSKNPNFSGDLIKKFINKINWRYFSRRKKLPEELIRDFADKVDWEYISEKQNFSEGFIREFADKVDWRNISRYQTLSEGFIRDFADKVDWRNISRYKRLSEKFIKEFADKVDWSYISEYQKLSEPFIREFTDRVNWGNILNFQNLSKKFKREFIHLLLGL